MNSTNSPGRQIRDACDLPRREGINIPYEQIDIAKGQNRSPEFLKLNPMGGLPVLELDDGTELAESVAILSLLRGAASRAASDGRRRQGHRGGGNVGRRMEFEILSMAAGSFATPARSSRAASRRFRVRRHLQERRGQAPRMAKLRVANRPYIAGDRFTIADITAMVGIDFGRPRTSGSSRSKKTSRDGMRQYRAVPARRRSLVYRWKVRGVEVVEHQWPHSPMCYFDHADKGLMSGGARRVSKVPT